QRRTGRRVIVYGAGDAAVLVAREILSGSSENRIVGFIDDDPRKSGIRVMGYPVLGGFSALMVLLKAGSIDAVVISSRRLAPERVNNLELACGEHNVELSRLRVGFEAIVSGSADQEPKTQPAHLLQIR